jgi:hypothetical protein
MIKDANVNRAAAGSDCVSTGIARGRKELPNSSDYASEIFSIATLPGDTMSSSPALRALLKLNVTPGQALAIKRLALIFDEILYLLPETHPMLNGNFLEDGRVRRQRQDGSFVDEEFNFFLHARRGGIYSERSLHDEELQETLAELSENGVASSIAPYDSAELVSKDFESVRDALAATDLCDERFRELSETSADQFERLTFKTIQSVDEAGNHVEDILIRAPNAIVDSYDLTDVLVLADSMTACPIFIDPHHQSELRYRYENARDPDEAVIKKFPELAGTPSVKTTFGAVSFAISSELFDADILARKKTAEIIKYRRNMAEARAQYVSADLLELTKLVETSPWSDKTKRAIELYVMGKLKQDIATYRATMKETWEKMFGSLAGGICRQNRRGRRTGRAPAATLLSLGDCADRCRRWSGERVSETRPIGR